MSKFIKMLKLVISGIIAGVVAYKNQRRLGFTKPLTTLK